MPETNWQVFSKHNKEEIRQENIHIKPITNEAFIESLASCKGLFCGSGFEAPAEALYLKKKLMVVPMKSQYEQQCNAAALKKMGIPVLQDFNVTQAHKIKEWVSNQKRIEVTFENKTDSIIDRILNDHSK